MALETGTYISDLVATNPLGSDLKSQGDDHIRLIKSTLQATFPNIDGAVTPTHTELNYVNGVTSDIQTQLDARANKSNPHFTGTITTEGNLELTEDATGDRDSHIDFHADDTNTDFSARIHRTPGVNGSFDIKQAGTGSVRVFAGGPSRVEVDSSGYIKAPYQPRCQASRTAGTYETYTVDTSYGILGTFSVNRGGFYAGSTVGASGSALHVPATGLYRVELQIYAAPSTGLGRLSVLKNNSAVICFINHGNDSAAASQSTFGFIEMTAGDYINLKCTVASMSIFNHTNYTYVTVEYLG